MEKHERFFVSVGAAIYNFDTKKFLVLKDADESSDYYKKFGPWELPGGRIHEGELAIDALKREIEEETGLSEFEVIGTVDASLSPQPYKEAQGFLVTYLVRYNGGEPKMSSEHSEFRWVSLEEMEEDEKEYKEWFVERIRKATKMIKESEYLNDLKRLQADFDNYKKRQQESQKELGGYLIEKLILDIVPVLDNFRSATMHVPPEQKESPWVVGIQYIEKQLEDVVKSNGVEVIETKEGDTFDPTIHEAVESKQKSESDSEEQAAEEKPHSVVKVLQKGFRLGGKVIRPAKVTVS